MNARFSNQFGDNSICHLIFSTAFGYSALIFRNQPFFVMKTLLPLPSKAMLIRSNKNDSWGKPNSCPDAIEVSNLIKNYFVGKPIRPPWKQLNIKNLTPLQQSVLKATAGIPFGETRSYKDIAEAIGRPRAHRFVGTTLANNPFPILIPCHRVIRSDRTYGQFGGGVELKINMLRHEALHTGRLSQS